MDIFVQTLAWIFPEFLCHLNTAALPKVPEPKIHISISSVCAGEKSKHFPQQILQNRHPEWDIHFGHTQEKSKIYKQDFKVYRCQNKDTWYWVSGKLLNCLPRLSKSLLEQFFSSKSQSIITKGQHVWSEGNSINCKSGSPWHADNICQHLDCLPMAQFFILNMFLEMWQGGFVANWFPVSFFHVAPIAFVLNQFIGLHSKTCFPRLHPYPTHSHLSHDNRTEHKTPIHTLHFGDNFFHTFIGTICCFFVLFFP